MFNITFCYILEITLLEEDKFFVTDYYFIN